MGFDIAVRLQISMCPETGQPFVYWPKTDGLVKRYDIPLVDYKIPEEFCKYATGRGQIFYAYTDYYNKNNVTDVDVYDFVANYPSWETVTQNANYLPEDWSETDHNGFKALLDWCVGTSDFRINWSY